MILLDQLEYCFFHLKEASMTDRGRSRTWFLVGFLALAVVLWLIGSGALSYLAAHLKYERLVAAKLASQAELERKLWFSSSQSIECSESAWTQSYSADSNRRCRRYLVLGSAPIDVVYDTKGGVVAILSSFE